MTEAARAAMNDVRRFVRRRPVVFLAGALVIGMVTAKVIRIARAGQVRRRSGQPGRTITGETDVVDTGTASRIEGGMEPALDAAVTDLPTPIEDVRTA